MSRASVRWRRARGSFPRVSGDEPDAHTINLDGSEFSPRERG